MRYETFLCNYDDTGNENVNKIWYRSRNFLRKWKQCFKKLENTHKLRFKLIGSEFDVFQPK